MIAGEAGPEAIMPLQRGSDGRLGVGVAPVNIQVNNNSSAQISVTREEDIIRIAVSESRAAAAGDFVKSMSSGYGSYARALEKGYNTPRMAT